MKTSANIIAKAPKIKSIQIGDASTNKYAFSTVVMMKVLIFGPASDGHTIVALYMVEVDPSKTYDYAHSMTIIPKWEDNEKCTKEIRKIIDKVWGYSEYLRSLANSLPTTKNTILKRTTMELFKFFQFT